MYFVFYGLHDTTLQICIISLYECFAYDITVVVKINLFQCQCQSFQITMHTMILCYLRITSVSYYIVVFGFHVDRFNVTVHVAGLYKTKCNLR